MLLLWLKFGRMHAARPPARAARASRRPNNLVEYPLYFVSVVKDATAVFRERYKESTCQVVNWPYREADSNSQYWVKC